MIYQPFPFKQCSVCKTTYPCTTEFFSADKRSSKYPDRLKVKCRNCINAYSKQWYNDNSDMRYRQTREYKKSHVEQYREYDRQWSLRHQDKIKAKAKKRYADNPQKAKDAVRQYRSLHQDELKASYRNWSKRNPDKIRARDQRRRSRKLSLPATFIESDWINAIEYFHGTCAYCTNPPQLWDNPRILHQDHYIPVNKSGGYTCDNIVPARQSCNLSKRDHDPLEWIAEHFGKRNATQISKRIADYFKWIESHGGHD